MDMVTVTTALAPVTGGLVSAAGACARALARRRRTPRPDVTTLPPGSRLIDLGDHGLIVEIGPPPSSPPTLATTTDDE